MENIHVNHKVEGKWKSFSIRFIQKRERKNRTERQENENDAIISYHGYYKLLTPIPFLYVKGILLRTVAKWPLIIALHNRTELQAHRKRERKKMLETFKWISKWCLN